MINVTNLDFGALEDAPELITDRQQWKLDRRGKFTASEFWKIMTNGRPKGAESLIANGYIAAKAVELLTAFDPEQDDYISAAMQWGLDHEVDAVSVFSKITGLTPYNTGNEQQFISVGGYGCTPDGLIGDDAGIEIKCPNSETHFQYLGVTDAASLKLIEPKYYWQVQGSMLVTGREVWWFVSYDPRFESESLQINAAPIFRNEDDINALKSRLDEAVIKRDKIIKK